MKNITLILFSSFVFLSQMVWIPVSHAGMISTKMSLQQSQNSQQQALSDILSRQQTQALLKTYGVDEQQLQSRINKLTAEELALINQKMDELPAGSGLLGTIGLVVVILVILDMLGVADIFTFIHPIN